MIICALAIDVDLEFFCSDWYFENAAFHVLATSLPGLNFITGSKIPASGGVQVKTGKIHDLQSTQRLPDIFRQRRFPVPRCSNGGRSEVAAFADRNEYLAFDHVPTALCSYNGMSFGNRKIGWAANFLIRRYQLIGRLRRAYGSNNLM
jgi:hypothetical protein